MTRNLYTINNKVHKFIEKLNVSEVESEKCGMYDITYSVFLFNWFDGILLPNVLKNVGV